MKNNFIIHIIWCPEDHIQMHPRDGSISMRITSYFVSRQILVSVKYWLKLVKKKNNNKKKMLFHNKHVKNM